MKDDAANQSIVQITSDVGRFLAESSLLSK